MEKLILVIHVLAALGVIGLVLLQHGKGADMGASFGSGASGSLFGVSGSSNFMSRATAICVVVFFATSLTLAYMASHKATGGSVVKSSAVNVEKTAPVAKPAELTTEIPAAETPATPATSAPVADDIPK
ncbi:MAG TPA: preprotein translocase subunit SecG [Methylotenera sp.]|nr:preprotein translocase subunit SecG [Methylotenera sp.]